MKFLVVQTLRKTEEAQSLLLQGPPSQGSLVEASCDARRSALVGLSLARGLHGIP